MSPVTRNRHHRYLRAAKRAHVGDPEALLDVAAVELTSRRSVRVPRCRYHCGACQRHFASEAAFDVHRVGEHGLPNGDPEGRRCSAPHEDDRVGSESGRCDVYGRQDGVTIYFLTGDREGVRKRLHGSGRSAEGV